MLWSNVNGCCNGLLILMGIITVCVMYAYHIDSQRPDDDPKKKNYHPLAILLAPITFPLFLVFYISLFILRVIAYAVFLVLFFFALIFIFILKPVVTEGL